MRNQENPENRLFCRAINGIELEIGEVYRTKGGYLVEIVSAHQKHDRLMFRSSTGAEYHTSRLYKDSEIKSSDIIERIEVDPNLEVVVGHSYEIFAGPPITIVSEDKDCGKFHFFGSNGTWYSTEGRCKGARANNRHLRARCFPTLDEIEVGTTYNSRNGKKKVKILFEDRSIITDFRFFGSDGFSYTQKGRVFGSNGSSSFDLAANC